MDVNSVNGGKRAGSQSGAMAVDRDVVGVVERKKLTEPSLTQAVGTRRRRTA